jgi:hypothetical protein
LIVRRRRYVGAPDTGVSGTERFRDELELPQSVLCAIDPPVE